MKPDKIKCFFGKHKKVYKSNHYCEENNLMKGIFRPWKCSRCNTKSTEFIYPKFPNLGIEK